jgi:ABC-type multidrug transport system ATPase subunit
MVEVQHLTKRFGKVAAVDDVSFGVATGEAVALWGANGAGKTTALRCLLGVIPFEGRIRLGGRDVRYQGKEARRLLGFVPQEISFHDDMTVRETLFFYGRLKKTALRGAHVRDLLERLGLAKATPKKVRDLSGGMKQRLALVIALLADPPLLMLDEPTANLDVAARTEFLALLQELQAAGKTLIFSSHRLEEVTGLADRVLVLEAGRLIADCPPGDLNRQLGRRTMLKLHLTDAAATGLAIETLAGYGFAAERNGTGIWVHVAPLQKARPIALLSDAGIAVDDFHFES